MTEHVETLDRKAAYQIAMKNLECTWNNPWSLRGEYPDRFFHYGEDGRGLILSHGLVYISSECAEDIRAVDGSIRIGEGLFLEDPKFRYLNGKLPQEAIGDVIDFTSEVHNMIKKHGEQVS